MKKTLFQALAVSIGIALNPGLSNGQTETSPAPTAKHGAAPGLKITLFEQAATVRQIAEDASKGFDPAKHAQELTRRINEILATLPPPPPSEPTNDASVSVPAMGAPAAGQAAPVSGPPPVGPSQEAGRSSGVTAPGKPALAPNPLRDAMGELEASVRRLKTHVDQLSERAERMSR